MSTASTPTGEIRRTTVVRPRRLTRGLDATVDTAVGLWRRRPPILREMLREGERIDALGPQYRDLSDRHLRERLADARARFRRGGKIDDETLRAAIAAIREASVRRLGMRPFVVQLAGALALHRGTLTEMATGEGKTLTAGVAAILGGWSRRPFHIVTVNDYLAERDADWMGPLYRFCGIRAGHVTGEMDAAARRDGYAADVAYCTGKEIVADFLRDRLRLGRMHDGMRRQVRSLADPGLLDRLGLVMRGLDSAIVDEADSVMIDEAVTPVIISSSHANVGLREACRIAGRIAENLARGADYDVRPRYREVELRDAGRSRIGELCAELPGLWRGPARREELVRQALTAREFFHRGTQYVVDDGKIVIVDEYTGRMMPQRTWREGLHQAVEAKEGIEITDPTETLARVSFQRFFRFFRRLSGMTGTAREATREFWHIYHLPVVTIPTNRPCIRETWADRAFPTAETKLQAVVDEIARLHGDGRPVLVGTRSVEASEDLSRRLADRELEHRVLNAVRHREEAQIVAEAGHAGQVTIATNMAGRGTDIKLGRGVNELGGLHVLATERHESRRIDRQLFGRSARQGDPGSAQTFVSAEDELIRRFTPAHLRGQLVAATRGGTDAGSILAGRIFARGQRAAGRLAYRQRRSVLMQDTWMEESLAFAGDDA